MIHVSAMLRLLRGEGGGRKGERGEGEDREREHFHLGVAAGVG